MSELPLLTNSRARAYRECPRKEQLLYQQGWRPVRESEALRFGTLVHLALEAYWLAVTTEDPLPRAMEAIKGKAFDAYEQVRAEEMIRAYCLRWNETDANDYEVLGVEIEFRAPLINPETFAASKTWQLAGKIDAILRRLSDGRVLVLDNKTTSEDIEGDDSIMWAKLVLDTQPTQYVLGAEALGYEVQELLWNVLKKPTQRPKKATPVEDRKFTKEGRLYATQREFDETPDEYRARVREAMEAEPERFCQRRAFPRSESQVQDYLFDIWQQAATMRESARLGRAPRNVDSCHARGVCPMWILCSTGAKPEEMPSDFVKVENVHPELGNASQG